MILFEVSQNGSSHYHIIEQSDTNRYSESSFFMNSRLLHKREHISHLYWRAKMRFHPGIRKFGSEASATRSMRIDLSECDCVWRIVIDTLPTRADESRQAVIWATANQSLMGTESANDMQRDWWSARNKLCHRLTVQISGTITQIDWIFCKKFLPRPASWEQNHGNLHLELLDSWNDSQVDGKLGEIVRNFNMVKHDEQEPLLGAEHTSCGDSESIESSTKDETKPGVDISTLIVLILGKGLSTAIIRCLLMLRFELSVGVFWSLGCESFVMSTHDDIASFFNQLSMGSWLLTAYNMGYCMMLPLVSQPSAVHEEQRHG